MQIKPIGGWINIPNYLVTNNNARPLGGVDLSLNGLRFTLVVSIRAILRGKSQDLFNVYDYTGSLVCTTDIDGWRTILEYIGIPKNQINTYTIVGSQVKMNNTQYSDFGDVSKITPLRVNSTNYYQCYGQLGTVSFTTDEQGYNTIVKGGDKPLMPNPFVQ